MYLFTTAPTLLICFQSFDSLQGGGRQQHGRWRRLPLPRMMSPTDRPAARTAALLRDRSLPAAEFQRWRGSFQLGVVAIRTFNVVNSEESGLVNRGLLPTRRRWELMFYGRILTSPVFYHVPGPWSLFMRLLSACRPSVLLFLALFAAYLAAFQVAGGNDYASWWNTT